MSSKRLSGVLALLAVGLVVAAGCARAYSQETSGGSASGAASSGEFEGVVASYETAQAEIDEEGGEQEVGEYRVGYIVEPAEGWWEGDPGSLEWREPAAGETNHIEVLPFEAESGLLVPGMEVELTILDGSGNEVESKPLSFLRSEFYHYANNFGLPESGVYTLRAELSPPGFGRHETEENEGKVFTKPASVEFEDVEIEVEGG